MASALLPDAGEKQTDILLEARSVAHWILTGDLDPGLSPSGDQAEGKADLSIIRRIIDARFHFDEGELEKAAELVSEVQTWNPQTFFQPTRYRLSLTVIEARASTALGDYDRALDAINGFLFSNPADVLYANGSLSFCQAFNELQQGKMREAHITIAEAVSELSVGDPEGLLDMACAVNDYLTRIHTKNEGTGQAAEAPIQPWADHSRKPARGYWRERDRFLSSIYRELSLARPSIRMLQASLEALAAQPNRVAEQEALFLCWSTGISKEFSNSLGRRFLAGQRSQHGKREEFQARLIGRAQAGVVAELEKLAGAAYENNEMVCAVESVARIVGILANAAPGRQQGLYLRQLDEWLGTLGGQPWGIVADTLAARGLTLREWEIVDLARMGLSNKDIAKKLTVSQRTVEGHLYRIFAKLGMRTRKELGEMESLKSRK
ncbi:hypothetical protein GCM10023166_24850 [Paeniglutamicibacter cryotolerans]